MYLLGDRLTTGIYITPVRKSEALIELVKHSFLLDVQARLSLSDHFEQLSRLVAGVPCYRLDYPRRFEALPAVRAAILRHCEG
jgi:hypothetical protein